MARTTRSTTTDNPALASSTTGINIVPFASMAGGWIAPLLMFWLYVWGPLRPFSYPAGDLAPPIALFVVATLLCVGAWWLPPAYYRVHRVERSGRVYEWLGVRLFRAFVPDGDLANRWRRRTEPSFRMIANRRALVAFGPRTEASEKSHIVLLLMGMLSATFAWQIGWHGWAVYLGLGNVLTNLYPVLLQRYTRSRLHRVLERAERRAPSVA